MCRLLAVDRTGCKVRSTCSVRHGHVFSIRSRLEGLNNPVCANDPRRAQPRRQSYGRTRCAKCPRDIPSPDRRHVVHGITCSRQGIEPSAAARRLCMLGPDGSACKVMGMRTRTKAAAHIPKLQTRQLPETLPVDILSCPALRGWVRLGGCPRDGQKRKRN